MHTSWFDDDGELTEITDSEDEDEPEIAPPPLIRPLPAPAAAPASTRLKSTRPSTQNATLKSRERNGLKTSTPCLKPPRTATYSASSLHDWVEQGLVDLDAEYQRGIVWNEAKQMNLIDSLFHNFYIPPIVFAVERQPDGSERRICIDGKQRLTSIHRFSKGDIAHKDSTTNRKSYFVNPPQGKKHRLISSQMQANFKNKQIACVEYDDLTPEQEREIFQRVQLGVTLAPADRLPAINGPRADLVRRLRNRIYTTTGFETYLEWGKARGKDFQALAQILYLIVHGHQPRKAEPQTTRLEAFLALVGDDTAALQETVYNVMDIFCRIVGDPELGHPLHHKLSPLELVMSGYLICLYRKKLSDTQLSDAIEHMRMDIKRTAPEPKFNTPNFKQLLNFVLKEVPKLIPRLKKGPVGEKPAFQVPYMRTTVPSRAMKESNVGSASSTNPKPAKTPAKRKRPVPSEKEDDSGSDSDFTMPAKKKRAPRQSTSDPSGGGLLPSISTASRNVLLGQCASSAGSNKPSARTTIRTKNMTSTKARQASTSMLNTPPLSSSARSSVANTKLGAQVAKPSVKPSPSARVASVSSNYKLTPQGSAPRVASSSSMSTELSQAQAPVVTRPLPGRARLSGMPTAITTTTMPTEQDFRRPSASNGMTVSEAAPLFDSSVRVARAGDYGNTTLPTAAAASTSSNPPLPIRQSKLSNIKFNRTHPTCEQASTSVVNEDRWKADTDALLHSIGSNSRASQPTPAPPSTLTSTTILPPLSSTGRAPRMVSQQVLAPQALSISKSNPGGGVQNPGQPLTPMTTPSPTFTHFQARVSGTGVPQPASSTTSSGTAPTGNGHPRPTGPKSMSSSQYANRTSDPRLARMNAQAELLAAQQARKASQSQPTSAMPTPPSTSTATHFPGGTSDPARATPKRPRAHREASSQDGLGLEGGVDSDEQQQQQAMKRGRSCRRQDS